MSKTDAKASSTGSSAIFPHFYVIVPHTTTALLISFKRLATSPSVYKATSTSMLSFLFHLDSGVLDFRRKTSIILPRPSAPCAYVIKYNHMYSR